MRTPQSQSLLPWVQKPATLGNLRRVFALVAVMLAGSFPLSSCSDAKRSAPGFDPHAFRIVATDEGYLVPETVAAGLVHVVFENQGTTIHEAMFVKLPDGMSGEEYLQAVNGGSAFPLGALDYSGPGLTSPGEWVETWLRLDPGNYLLACWFQGHLTSLSAQTITVCEPESADVIPPNADVTLKLIDFRFELEGHLGPGLQTLRVETPGPSMHEVDIFRLERGRTIADLRQWHKQGKKGPAPAVAVGGVLDSHDLSRVAWLRVNFRRGRYVLWCSMAMVPDGHGPAGELTHADAGMFKEFEIKD